MMRSFDWYTAVSSSSSLVSAFPGRSLKTLKIDQQIVFYLVGMVEFGSASPVLLRIANVVYLSARYVTSLVNARSS